MQHILKPFFQFIMGKEWYSLCFKQQQQQQQQQQQKQQQQHNTLLGTSSYNVSLKLRQVVIHTRIRI